MCISSTSLPPERGRQTNRLKSDQRGIGEINVGTCWELCEGESKKNPGVHRQGRRKKKKKEKTWRNSVCYLGDSLVEDDLDGVAWRSLNDPFAVKGLLIELRPARGEDDPAGSLQISPTRGCRRESEEMETEGKRADKDWIMHVFPSWCMTTSTDDLMHQPGPHPISFTARAYLM